MQVPPFIATRWRKANRNIRAATIVALVFCVWMLTGVFGCSPQDNTGQASLSPKTVTIHRLTSHDFKKKVHLNGHTEPKTLAALSAQTEGTVTLLHVQKGDAVEKGQSLLQMDMLEKQAQLKAARAHVREANALYKAAKKLNREGFKAETELASQEALLADAELALAVAQMDVEHANVPSPIDGFVDDRHVNIGEFVKSGDPLFTLVSQQKTLLVGYTSQKNRSLITPGLPALAHTASGATAQGTVSFVALAADDLTRTYRVEAEIDSSKNPLPLGMSTHITIPVATIKAHKIPHSAMVLDKEGNLGVMLYQEGKVHFFGVIPLQDDRGGIWVEGLPDQISLVVRGQGAIISGESVKATEEPAS